MFEKIIQLPPYIKVTRVTNYSADMPLNNLTRSILWRHQEAPGTVFLGSGLVFKPKHLSTTNKLPHSNTENVTQQAVSPWCWVITTADPPQEVPLGYMISKPYFDIQADSLDPLGAAASEANCLLGKIYAAGVQGYVVLTMCRNHRSFLIHCSGLSHKPSPLIII